MDTSISPAEPDFTARFGEMQEIIDRKMRQGGVSVDEMTVDALEAFIEATEKYVEFEGRDLKGSIIAASGNGGILVAENGEVVAAQEMGAGDKIIGMIDDFGTFPVPSLRLMCESAGGDVSLHDKSMSAVVFLDGAYFCSGLRPDGSYAVRADLSQYRVLLPAVYGMTTETVDLYEF